MSPSDLIHHHIDDRLGETDRVAGHGLQLSRHFLDQIRFRLTEFPCTIGFQSHATLHMRE